MKARRSEHEKVINAILSKRAHIHSFLKQDAPSSQLAKCLLEASKELLLLATMKNSSLTFSMSRIDQ